MWLCKDKDMQHLVLISSWGCYHWAGRALTTRPLREMLSCLQAKVSYLEQFCLSEVGQIWQWLNNYCLCQVGPLAVQYCSVFSFSIQFQNTSLIKCLVFINKDSKSWPCMLMKNLEQTFEKRQQLYLSRKSCGWYSSSGIWLLVLCSWSWSPRNLGKYR